MLIKRAIYSIYIYIDNEWSWIKISQIFAEFIFEFFTKITIWWFIRLICQRVKWRKKGYSYKISWRCIYTIHYTVGAKHTLFVKKTVCRLVVGARPLAASQLLRRQDSRKAISGLEIYKSWKFKGKSLKKEKNKIPSFWPSV